MQNKDLLTTTKPHLSKKKTHQLLSCRGLVLPSPPSSWCRLPSHAWCSRPRTWQRTPPGQQHQHRRAIRARGKRCWSSPTQQRRGYATFCRSGTRCDETWSCVTTFADQGLVRAARLGRSRGFWGVLLMRAFLLVVRCVCFFLPTHSLLSLPHLIAGVHQAWSQEARMQRIELHAQLLW